MSNISVPRPGNGNGNADHDDGPDLSAVIARTIRHVEHVDQQLSGIVDDIIEIRDDIRVLKKSTTNLEKTQVQHSIALADIAACLVRIEKRLGATEETAKRAERISTTNEVATGVITDFARVALEGDRAELEAKKARLADRTDGRREWRRSHIKTIAVIVGFVFSAVGASVLTRACSSDAHASEHVVDSVESESP